MTGTKRIRAGGWLVLVCAGLAVPVWGAGTSLTPQHRRQLQAEIQACVNKVNACATPEPRCEYQEELCKKLLQAEDYENALRVAQSIQATKGGNPERRAAHHFLVAQIYALRMEASSSIAELEQNRRMALQVAEEVIQQKYPAKWQVGEAAAGLARDLQNPERLKMLQVKIAKRQRGTTYLETYAGAQKSAIEQAVKENRGGAGAVQRVSGGIFGRKATRTASSSPAKAALKARGITLSDSKGAPSRGSSRVSYSSSGARVSDATASRNSTNSGSSKLSRAYRIDSNGVHPVPASSVSSASRTSRKSAPASRSGIGSPSSRNGS